MKTYLNILKKEWWLQLHKLIQFHVVSLPSGGGRENYKFLELIYLQSHIYKNIPVSFDFITT
jgi:hypothetical protein